VASLLPSWQAGRFRPSPLHRSQVG
jgi:hypothetical protein